MDYPGSSDYIRRSIAQVHHRSRATVIDILDNHKVDSVWAEARVYECPRCATLSSRFHVSIDYDMYEAFQTTFKCRRCRSALLFARWIREYLGDRPQSLSKYACPKCGEKALEENGVLIWD